MFTSIFQNGITIAGFITAFATSVFCGFAIALTYKHTNKTSKDFLTALTIIPFIVMTVIMLVNGNLGIGVAVAGTFSLVRFRSLPGSASDIAIIFLSMALGLASGTGCIAIAITLSIIACILMLILSKTTFLNTENTNHKSLKILISETQDQEEFTEIIKQYCNNYKLSSVKTVDLGLLYELTYEINMKNANDIIKLIDDIRIKNGNLTVRISDYYENISDNRL